MQSPSSSPHSLLIVGAGGWGKNTLRNFVLSGRVQIAGIVDPDPKALNEVKKIAPLAKGFSSLEEALKEVKPTAVSITTPPERHFEGAKKALNAGAHLLIAKPFCTTSAECEEVLRLAKSKDRVLLVDHTYAYHPAVTYLASEAKKGSFGALHYFDSVRANFGKFQSANVIWDLAPHDLSILDLILKGELPTEVSAVGASHVGGVVELAYATLKYPSGLLAHFHLSWVSPIKTRLIRLGGSEKMAIFDDNQPAERVKIYDRKVEVLSSDVEQLRVGYRSGAMIAPVISDSEALSSVIHHFLDCIEKKATPLTDGGSGLRVVQILEALTESLQANGKPVSL